MPDRPDRPRLGRKGNKKVRTGCRTCKIRKVKCDETKPFCHRCINSGRQCDGYAPVPPRARRTAPASRNKAEDDDTEDEADDAVTRRQSFSSSDGTLVAARSPGSDNTPYPSPTYVISDGNAALKLYHHRTAPRLAGFLDGYFWNELVLQLGDIEPAIKHALGAMNAIYSYFEGRGNAPLESELARLKNPAYAHGIQEYNRSIGALVRQQTTTGHDASVHLVCCVLFVCIELLANETLAAMNHFGQGLRLLATCTAGAEGSPEEPRLKKQLVRKVLAPIFRRLNVQAVLIGRNPPLLPLFKQMYHAHDVRTAKPFETLSEASQALVAIMELGVGLVQDVVGLDTFRSGAKYNKEKWEVEREDLTRRRVELLEDLDIWLEKFSPFSAWCMTLGNDPKERYGTYLLKIQQLTSVIWIYGIMEATESAYDLQITNFGTIINLCVELAAIEKTSQDPTVDSVFTFEMGAIAPLYLLITKCRERRIRRAGLHLLENWPRRENVWNPEQIARIAWRQVELEDPDFLDPNAPLNVWPPEWKRIHRTDLQFERDVDGNILAVALMHRKPLGPDGEWEIIRDVVVGVQAHAPPNTPTAGPSYFTAK